MRLATIRIPGGARAVRLDGGQAVETGHDDAGELLARPDWHALAAAADGARHPAASLDLAPVIPHPGKVVCVGLNYRQHILEMGRGPCSPTSSASVSEAVKDHASRPGSPAAPPSRLSWAPGSDPERT
jgi:acylpyruvate hydrolase